METVLGKYEIRATIAAGGRSTVYEGWDASIGRRVAIKQIPLSTTGQLEGWQPLARFKREAQAAGRLQHPNVVAIFDYGETSESAYIVMELVEGATLDAALKKGTRFSTSAISRLMSDILAGLQYCHERGVVHRDIKPSNVMVTRDGHAKIADFGIARVEDSNLTQIGMVMGTPAYMSPEQFRGGTTDASTDIYSAGVILYQLLTGDRPFDGSVATIMHKALNTQPPRPSELSAAVPPLVDGVVARAMAKRPDQRFRSATEFSDALSNVLTARQSNAAPGRVDALAAIRSVGRRASAFPKVYAIGGAAVLMAAAGIGALVFWSPTSGSGSRPRTEISAPAKPPATEHAAASSAADGSQNAEQQGPANSASDTASLPSNRGARPDAVPPALQPDAAPFAAPSAGQASLLPAAPIPSTGIPSTGFGATAPVLVPTPAPSTTAYSSPVLVPKDVLPPQRGSQTPRDETRAPGPRVTARKAPQHSTESALDAGAVPAPNAGSDKGAKNSTQTSDAGSKQVSDPASKQAGEVPAKPLAPRPFGRYEVVNGQRVFIPAYPGTP